jgi:nucleoside-diphosphate-sugar epimerase
MKVLVLGASGATGRRLVAQLVERGIEARVVIREGAVLPDGLAAKVEVVRGNVAEFDAAMNSELIAGCDAVACCLGHNITFKGLFGAPRLLVTRSLRNFCDAVTKQDRRMKVVLMSTTANEYGEAHEGRSFGERLILSILYMLLPPHRDNIRAAKHLSAVIGKGNGKLEWTAVRPDSLFNEEKESPYEAFEAIQRSPLFNSGKTSRINVGHFMAELLTDEGLWKKWKYRMPVIYNKEL